MSSLSFCHCHLYYHHHHHHHHQTTINEKYHHYGWFEIKDELCAWVSECKLLHGTKHDTCLVYMFIYIRAGQTAAREPHVAREPHFYNSKIEGEEGELGHP